MAQFVPPHMAERVTSAAGKRILPVDYDQIMFLGMQPKPPFDNKLVRQAVAYAIDRDAIIQG
jgi:ABC-type transport system substrate-binding protein